MSAVAMPNGPVDAAALLTRIGRDRDRGAFRELFAAYAPRLKSYLLRLGADAGTAEELTQEAFLSVWRRAETFDRNRGSASTWMFVIARNCRIDALRRERLDLVYDDTGPEPVDPAIGPEQAASDEQQAAAIRVAMETLSVEQREVVRLSYFEDKPHSEIAAQLGLPLGTVKSRLRLAMTHLRAHLENLT